MSKKIPSDKVKIKYLTPLCSALLAEKIRMEMSVDVVNETRSEYYGNGDGYVTITITQSRGTTFKITVGSTTITTKNSIITVKGLGERGYHDSLGGSPIYVVAYNCTIQEIGIPNLPVYAFVVGISGPENAGGAPYITYNGQTYTSFPASIPLGVIQIN